MYILLFVSGIRYPSCDSVNGDNAFVCSNVRAVLHQELFVLEISWSKNTHPSLGWSYHAGLLRDISREVSPAQLLRAATEETTYEKLRNEA